MTTRAKLTTTVIAAFTLALASTSAHAVDYRHLDRLAIRLTKNSEALFREFRVHYRHTSEYRHLISDAKALRSRALHIHEVAHHRGSLYHLASDVREMDQLFHHLEEVVERVDHRSSHDYHSGHVHGNSRHVSSLMRTIGCDLHHLGEDVEMATPRSSYNRRPRVVVPAPYRTLRVPVPSRPALLPAAPMRSHRLHGTTSIPTPFGRLTVHHY